MVDPERARGDSVTSSAPSRADHDRVVRFVAKNRFPFPGQTDWPADNVTLTNETTRQRGISTPEGTHYPDILVIARGGALREVAEVETELTDETAKVWGWGSAASDTKTKTGVRHFFVYVPDGLGQAALRFSKATGSLMPGSAPGGSTPTGRSTSCPSSPRATPRTTSRASAGSSARREGGAGSARAADHHRGHCACATSWESGWPAGST